MKGTQVGSNDSDYEIFSPHTFKQNKCVLGKKVNYQRRKPDRECYNGQEFDRILSEELCSCTFEDYECDFGFFRQGPGMPCIPLNSRFYQINISKECFENQYSHYLFSLGYRKILGNRCEGGSKFDPILLSCPKFYFGVEENLWKLIFALAFCLMIIWIFYIKWFTICKIFEQNN